MPKLRSIVIGSFMGLSALSLPAVAQPAGPFAQDCLTGDGPALLVQIVGLKSQSGTVRVQAYGGDPRRWFDKGTYLKRIDVPASEAREICVPVPRAGTYAVSVRHDANGNGKSDKSDGGGMSGNPDVSLIDLMFKRKPNPQKVQVKASGRVTTVPVVVNYIQGGSFEPLKTARR